MRHITGQLEGYNALVTQFREAFFYLSPDQQQTRSVSQDFPEPTRGGHHDRPKDAEHHRGQHVRTDN
jgi:hypothetical protein